MSRSAFVVPALLLLSALAGAADKPPAAAGHKDTKFLLDYMKRTRADFLKSIKGVSPAQWNFKAAPDRWSIAETAEHITLSEDFIRNMCKDKIMTSPPAADAEKAKANLSDEDIIAKVTDRSHKAQAPEPLKPTHQWADAKAIEKEFKARREVTMKYAKDTPEPELRRHVAPSPLGAPLDGYQFLVLLSAHTKRHTLQIEEVKADPNYPKK